MVRKHQFKIFSLNTYLVIFFLGLGFNQVLNAQEELTKEEKKINKCAKIYNKGKHEKGIAKLRKFMAKWDNPPLYAYETLVAMEFDQYKRKAGGFGVNIQVETNGVKNDSLTKTFQDLMVGFYLDRFMNVCRRSTIESTSPSADMYLRQFLVDTDPDTAISEKGQAYFDEAEEFFVKRDFELAGLNYRKAFKQDSTFYKAYMYYGDSFWAREMYDSALVYYEQARELQPNLLEPRLYIIDALSEKGLYYRAKKECLNALTVYPGYNLKFKLQRILSMENKYMNERRFIRYFYPNDMGDEEQQELTGAVWMDYRKAKEEVSKYCNEDGIIEENGEVEDRYLEVYSYRRVLEQHANDLPEVLEFADKMREEGMLEPYIFISLFHVDIYPQFKDYMSSEENREKALDFIDKYLIEEIPQY